MTQRRLTLWLVALVCFGPFLVALVAYYGPWGHAWLPQLAGSRELLDAGTTVAALVEEDTAQPRRWALIYARAGTCAADCAADLDRIRQVHWALGPEHDRVRRVFLHGAGALPPDGQGELAVAPLALEALAADPALGRAFAVERVAAGRVYIADPRGNLVTSYAPDVDQKELLRDLERLLDASAIG